MRIIILIFLLFSFGAKAQNEKAAVDLINHIYISDSSTFVFDLKQIPSAVINRILRTNDSIDYLIHKERHKTNLKEFLANTDQEWNETDVISNSKLPSRGFIYAVRLNSKWVLTYEHGGIGSHYHIVYVDENNLSKLTISVTLLNSRQINQLVFDKKKREIANRPFKTIVKEGEFKMLNGKLIQNYDVL